MMPWWPVYSSQYKHIMGDLSLILFSLDTTNSTFQIKLRWALFVTYTIIRSIMRSEMCSLHLTHPSALSTHTPGAVGSQHCSARGAVGGSVPCSRVSPQLWTLPARAHNLGLPRVSSPTLYPLGHDCPHKKMERFTDMHVILSQGTCKSSMYRSNFSICAAMASKDNVIWITITSKELYLKPVFREILRILL